jgi:hypothetical protein
LELKEQLKKKHIEALQQLELTNDRRQRVRLEVKVVDPEEEMELNECQIKDVLRGGLIFMEETLHGMGINSVDIIPTEACERFESFVKNKKTRSSN